MARICFPKALIERREDMDFSDDGTRFRGYFYKGAVPITYTKVDGTVYCSIRFDYCGIPCEDYKNMWRITDEFNGVSADKFNMDAFINNCEESYKFLINYNSPYEKIARFYKKIDTINDKIKSLEVQIKELENMRNQYYKEIDSVTV